MEKSTEREIWVVYNRGKSATWFATDDNHTARQKAEAFLKTASGQGGKIVEKAKTAEQALASYNSKEG